MSARRSRGDGGLYFDQSRNRWIAAVTVGYSPAGKRIVRKASGTIKTAAQRRLKAILRDYKDGLLAAPGGRTRRGSADPSVASHKVRLAVWPHFHASAELEGCLGPAWTVAHAGS
jgi:hypothetical protein